MAGVFLREGERLVMRSCVGHRRAHTARLCIEQATGWPDGCSNRRTVQSRQLSGERRHQPRFNPLALAELRSRRWACP